MRTFVPLPHGLSATAWRRRYANGEVPDESPYGLHKLAHHGVDVTFGETDFGRVTERVARSLRYRTSDTEWLEGVANSRARERRNTDLVLAYDERTGIPASLLRTRWHAPVLHGLIWLTTRAATPKILAASASRALPRAAAVWVMYPPMMSLGREWGIPDSRLHLVPFGIDTDFYGVQPEPDVPDVIVGAGEDRDRDHRLLVSAVSSLRTRHPHIQLELATGLPVDLPEGLGNLHRGRLYGRIRHLYQKASVVAIALKPNARGAGMSVALEAMSSGRPVVMTDNPGISHYVEHGVTGLLVAPNDLDAFASAVSELLADPQRRADMGKAAAIRVRDRFTTSMMARNLAAIANSV
jgi:glycosyltransferase involved in cell wall biosynthesis